jgi:hypothetical protein
MSGTAPAPLDSPLLFPGPGSEHLKLLPDAEQHERALLDAFDAREEEVAAAESDV